MSSRSIDTQLDRSIKRLRSLIADREFLIERTECGRSADMSMQLLLHRLRLVEENRKVVERFLRPLR